MTISSPEREVKKVKIAVDRNPVETSFEKWACDLKQELGKKKGINRFSSLALPRAFRVSGCSAREGGEKTKIT